MYSLCLVAQAFRLFTYLVAIQYQAGVKRVENNLTDSSPAAWPFFTYIVSTIRHRVQNTSKLIESNITNSSTGRAKRPELLGQEMLPKINVRRWINDI